MALRDEIAADVTKIFGDQWTKRDGEQVPDPEDLNLGNDAVSLDTTVLYADMADSTRLVDQHKPHFAAEVYKSYLICAARIIKDEGGAITAYDGDRIMAVFIGQLKNTTAARTALKINYAVKNTIGPALTKQYPNTAYKLKHTIGIDTSTLFTARIGVRNDNDLVWVGRAANYAAKLTAINDDDEVFITSDVFNRLHEDSKYGGDPRKLMWTARQWTAMNNMAIYSSNWTWRV